MHKLEKTRGCNESSLFMPKTEEPKETEDKFILAIKQEKKNNDASNAKKSDTKLPVTLNQRKQINQNCIEGRLLFLATKNLDKQLSTSQMQIKRNRNILLDQYLEAKAVNFNTANNNINNNNNTNNNNLTSTSIKANLFGSQSLLSDRNSISSLENRSLTERTTDFFSSSGSESFIKELKFENNRLSEKPYKSYLDSITEKFVDQKRTCYPRYLKKSSSLSSYDVDKVMGTFVLHFIIEGFF